MSSLWNTGEAKAVVAARFQAVRQSYEPGEELYTLVILLHFWAIGLNV